MLLVQLVNFHFNYTSMVREAPRVGGVGGGGWREGTALRRREEKGEKLKLQEEESE